MRVGLSSDALPHLDRPGLLAWCAERGVTDIEACFGPWTRTFHFDLQSLLAERSERDRLRGELKEHGLTLAALNGAGNPLHPDPASRATSVAAIRGAVELAGLLGVDRVIAMSGCPGGRGGGDTGIFGIWSIVLDDEALWEWQFEHHVAPFWREISAYAAEVAPDARILFELHPGAAIFNPAGFERLSELVGANVGINLDPSHFWWQGMDPVTIVEALGPAIGFAHGKDTTIYPERVRMNGLLDHQFPVDPAKNAWHFSAVGDGHSTEEWGRLFSAMRRAGFDGTIAIEQEDPTQPAEASVERSVATLREAIALTEGVGVGQAR